MTRDTTNYIVIHCSATPPSADIGREEINRWHENRGWFGIGYHLVIRRDGSMEYGRAHDVQGAHVKGHNHESIGVCLVGGIDAKGHAEDNFTEKQIDTLHWATKLLKDLYPEAQVLGHRDMPGVHKACPSFDAAEKLKDLDKWSWMEVGLS